MVFCLQCAAGEIIPEESRTGEVDDLGSEALQTVDGRSEHDGKKTGSSEAALSPIRIRFRKVESELSGVLSRLKSSSSSDISHKASESSCDDEVLKLYDDLEFRETEIMHHKDKLRSTRAKLAIMEGRMALAVIDAQRLEEQKRKSASSARKALQFLSTVYLSWTNKATEVLVTGSFDGWATKRKMNMSKTTGVFSLYMKLYPGKYEIKFIVDGEWKVDVLRPTVEYRGYVNNVLIVY
ncbi:Protein PTST homolog 2, chloroplastic [Linum perenne]